MAEVGTTDDRRVSDAYLQTVIAQFTKGEPIAAMAAELVSLRGQLASVRELAEAALVAQSFPVRQCWAEFVAINVAAGGPDPRCGATDGQHTCIQIAGHVTPDGLHDDGSFAFFVAGSERAS